MFQAQTNSVRLLSKKFVYIIIFLKQKILPKVQCKTSVCFTAQYKATRQISRMYTRLLNIFALQITSNFIANKQCNDTCCCFFTAQFIFTLLYKYFQCFSSQRSQQNGVVAPFLRNFSDLQMITIIICLKQFILKLKL